MQNKGIKGRRESAVTGENKMQRAPAVQNLPARAADENRAMPEDVSILGVPDLEKLQLILDRSLRVCARSHFFVWALGILQALLPHEIMVCALAGAHTEEFIIDVLSSTPLSAGVIELLCRPVGGFIAQLARGWKHAGLRPLAYQRESAVGNVDAQVAAVIAGAPINNFAAHGMCAVGGPVASLFVLLNQSGGIGARQIYLLETLLPFLHVTWLRVHLGQSNSCGTLGSIRELNGLSAREVEVIHCLQDGKSNSQIGIVLKISPLTVKNHVQNILRKLNARNRAQAVVKSLTLGILDPARRA